MLFLLLLAAQDFSGSEACAACHSAVATSQQKTHHARALRRETDGRWAFGAGAQAVTWVSQASQDEYLEHGLSWYRKAGALSVTPGHSGSDGIRYRTFAPDAAILRCFQCHSTGALRLSDSRTILPAEPGVRCEACHGPGAAHAASPDKGNVRNPAKLNAAEVNQLCGQCHRMPPAQGVATNFGNAWNVRHQPVYFSQSKCFLRSNGRFSCLSCHNPHEDTRPAADARCAECHTAPKHTTQVAQRSCVACHMPRVGPSPLLSFANHWIGIYQLTGPRANLLRPIEQRARR